MPDNANNSPTLPPLDESAMLAWIEGRLSKIEETDLARRARPGTVERVQQMQANRRALQSVREERAPAELMDRVLAALERDALVGLSNGQDLYEHPPISIATATTKEKKGPSWAQRHAPALALAAGIALLLAGAAYWSSLLFKSGKTVQVAGGTDTTPAPAHADENASRLAINQSPADTQTPPALADTDLNAGHPAETANIEPATPALTPGRMLALARQGRLVMRVKAHDLTKLADVEAPAKYDRPWKLSKDVPSAVVAAIVPKAAPIVGPMPESQPVIAGSKVITPLLGPGAAMNWALDAAADPASRVRATYLLDLPNTEQNLDHIKLVFKDRLKADVSFEALDEAVQAPQTQDPETLLWWTLPPAQWVERVTVPVVVEAR
jgi:hypothetical protein